MEEANAQASAPAGVANRVETLRALARSDRQPAEFWADYLEASAQVCGAWRTLLIARREGSWRVFQQWPARQPVTGVEAALAQRLAEAAAEQGYARVTVEAAQGVATRIEVTTAEAEYAIEATILVVLLGAEADALGLEALLRLAADVPAHYESRRALRQAQGKSERLFDALSLSTRIGAETRFMKAALTLCNELAARFECDRVALGWLQAPYIRLQAISHIEKFDRQMAAARQLESVMEEALDQDEDVVYPLPPGHTTVVRSHDQYARTQGAGHLASLPLRVADATVAVVTAERQGAPFSPAEVWEMRLIGDATAGALAHLQHQDRWFGARLACAVQAAVAGFWTVEHSLAKLVGVALVALLVATSLIDWPYRVETAFTLRSKDVAFVPAPFDGYIGKVHVEIGDAVRQGELLVDLDRRELDLEAASVAADVSRYARESEKALSVESLADMQIADARRNQSAARLGLIRKNLNHARVAAPMDGIVVEGDLKAKLAASVRKGDLLFKVARIEQTYAELEIPEMDVHEIRIGQQGELAFVGRPDIRLAIRIDRLDPVAAFKDGKNVFLARAVIAVPAENWWRPGMGGTAKIDVGPRPILWILTHRTLRFLQKVFWL